MNDFGFQLDEPIKNRGKKKLKSTWDLIRSVNFKQSQISSGSILG